MMVLQMTEQQRQQLLNTNTIVRKNESEHHSNNSTSIGKVLNDKKSMMEESLECTAILSPSSQSTVLMTSPTASMNSTDDDCTTDHNNSTEVTSSTMFAAMNDGPTNHCVQVNYITTTNIAATKVPPEISSSDILIQQQPIQPVLLHNNDDDDENDNNDNIVQNNGNKTNESKLNDSAFATKDTLTTSALDDTKVVAIDEISRYENDPDEASSTGSTNSSSFGYFDPSDFDTTTWNDVVASHPTTVTAVGIVTVVALATTAIAHPILFVVASAITAAVGTVTAAITQQQSSLSTTTTTTTPTSSENTTNDTDIVKNTNASTSVSSTTCSTLLCDFHNPFQPSSCSSSSSSDNNHDKCKKDELETTNTIEPIDTSIQQLSMTSQSLNETLSEIPINTITMTPQTVNVQCHSLSKNDHENWLLKYFPPLAHSVGCKNGSSSCFTKSSASLAGLNTIDAFRVFFHDDAPYSFLTFQEKRGDLHIEYGKWNTIPMVGSISMFDHKESKFFPKEIHMRSYQCRTLHFHAKTNAMLGPPYAKTTKVQKFLQINRRVAILEGKTTLSGIPFCDRFYVGERWIFIADKIQKQQYVTNVYVSCEVFFNGPGCPFESQIKNKSISTINDVISSWCIMAIEALKLTERAKLDRLQRTATVDDHDDDETVDTHQLSITEGEDYNDVNNPSTTNENDIEVVADEELLMLSNSTKIVTNTNNSTTSMTKKSLRHQLRRKNSKTTITTTTQ